MVAVVLLLFLSSLVTLRFLRMMVDSAIDKETTEMAAATVAVDLVVMIKYIRKHTSYKKFEDRRCVRGDSVT